MDENKTIYPEDDRGSLEILDSCPKPDQQNISTGAVVKLLVNKDLDPSTVHEGAVILGSGRWHVKGNVYYDDRVITYIPVEPLWPNTRYDFYINVMLRDTDGFALTPNVSAFTFHTGDPGMFTCR